MTRDERLILACMCVGWLLQRCSFIIAIVLLFHSAWHGLGFGDPEESKAAMSTDIKLAIAMVGCHLVTIFLRRFIRRKQNLPPEEESEE
jgi:hypothetical protein